MAPASFRVDPTSELASFPDDDDSQRLFTSMVALSVVAGTLRSINRNRPLPFLAAAGSLEWDRRFLWMSQIPLDLGLEGAGSLFGFDGAGSLSKDTILK